MVSIFLIVGSHIQDSSVGGFLLNLKVTVGVPELSFVDTIIDFNRVFVVSKRFPLVCAEQMQ